MNRHPTHRLNRRSLLRASLAAVLPVLGAPVRASATGDNLKDWYSPPVATSQGSIAHRDTGSGPAALFLHGWPLCSIEWRQVLPGLAPLRRCLAPDMLGLGASVPADGADLAPRAQVALLAEYLDRLGVQDVDLVANDTGAMLAQLFTARYPQRVRSLLLSNCDVAGDSPPPAFAPLAKAAAGGRLADLFIRPQLQDLQRARSARGIGAGLAQPERLTAELVAAYMAPLVATPQRAQQFNTLSAALGVDELTAVQPQLARYRGPVRIVWGMQDRLFAHASADVLDRTFAASRGVLKVEDANLYVPEDRPDLIVQQARQLWQA